MPVVTNTVRRPDGSVWAYAPVAIGIIGPGFDGVGGQLAGVSKTLTNSGGVASFTLAATTTGSYYVWTGPDGRQVNFTMPSSGGPYSLQSLSLGGTTPPGVPAASADALAALAAQVSTGGGGTGSANLTDLGNGTFTGSTTTGGTVTAYTKTGADAVIAPKVTAVVEASGSYGTRPAGTGPVFWIGPDAPAGGGTTAGGGAAVNGLDIYLKTS